MELLYAWIKEPGDEHGLGFNLGGRKTFEFNEETKTLTAKDNENYIENFFSLPDNPKIKLTNITALVGKNGAGKTTALQKIMKAVFGKSALDRTSPPIQALLVVKKGANEILLKRNFDDLRAPDFNQDMIENFNHEAGIPYLRDQLIGAYFSSGNSRGMNSSKALEMLSKGADFVDLSSNDSHENQISRNINMLVQTKDSREKLIEKKFELPEELNIRPNLKRVMEYEILLHSYATGETIFSQSDFLQEIHKLTPIPSLRELSSDAKLRKWLLAGFNSLIYIAYFDFLVSIEPILSEVDLFGAGDTGSKTEKSIFNRLCFAVTQVEKEEDCSDTINSVLVSLRKPLERHYPLYLARLNGLCDYIDYVKNLEQASYLDQFNVVNRIVTYWFGSRRIQIRLPEIDVFLFKKDEKGETIGAKYVEKYSKIFATPAMVPSDIGFRGLSEGQYCILDLFTAIFEGGQAVREGQSLLFFLDEPDVYLHPEWERNLINELVVFSKELTQVENIQFIITTNKPIMLSDLPRSNVIFLDNCQVSKEDKITHTFAQNIHTLYRQNFFMKDGLMGAFASRKLKGIASKIPFAELNELRDFKQILPHIGEKILKRRLEELILKWEEIAKSSSPEAIELRKLQIQHKQLKEAYEGIKKEQELNNDQN